MKTRRARRLGSARTADRGRGECMIWARAGASLERCGRPGTPLAGDGLLLLTPPSRASQCAPACWLLLLLDEAVVSPARHSNALRSYRSP